MSIAGRNRMVGICLLALCAGACSDDDTPPARPDGAGVDAGDGGATDQGPGVDGAPWDGFDPVCPMPGPCVREKYGEKMHAGDFLVIGEVLTLNGENLQDVTKVYVGAKLAPVLQVSATRVTCRIGPTTPTGQHTVEIATDATRRMVGVITVRRLVLLSSATVGNAVSYQVSNRSAGPVFTLSAPPIRRPRVGPSGRYWTAVTSKGLVVVDLARETAATVSGLASPVQSLAQDAAGEVLLVVTTDGALHRVDLTSFPSLSAVALSAAPGTGAVLWVQPDLWLGLHPSAGSGEGSLWSAAADLSSFGWVAAGGTPLLVGGGSKLSSLAAGARGDKVGWLVDDGAAVHLVSGTASGGTLGGAATASAASAHGLALLAGADTIALSADSSAPELHYVQLAQPTTVHSLSLGGSGAARQVSRAQPTRNQLALVLVGPVPAQGSPFDAQRLAVVDLAQGKLLGPGGEIATNQLTLIRDVVGDPTEDKLHLITDTEFHSYYLQPSGATVVITEHHPQRALPTDFDGRWIAVQP